MNDILIIAIIFALSISVIVLISKNKKLKSKVSAIASEDEAPASYLTKGFLEELNYKLWSTKGSRFNSDKRLRRKGKASNVGLAIISAYLIIASLITVFDLETGLHPNALNFLITALSILVLVFSQFENAQNYELNAKMHHDSGLKISELYNELRIFKTLKENPSNCELLSFSKDITKRYEAVLKNSSNHSRIDYDEFLLTNIEYMTKTNPDKVKHLSKYSVKVNYYWNVYGWYFLLVIIPPALFAIIIIITQSAS